ncbi:hypothetical protein EV363DRAFT_1377853, partial [Boletus edulis]
TVRCLRATTSSLVLPALLVLACFSAPTHHTLPPFPFRRLAAHFPWVRSARTRLPCRCTCEAFPPALAAHAPPGKSGSRPGPKSAPRSYPSTPSLIHLLPLVGSLAYRAMSKDVEL